MPAQELFLNDYIIVPLKKVKQGKSEFYSAVVDILNFKEISTISAAEYILNATEVERDESGDIIYELLNKNKQQGYQRQRESWSKVSEIASYIASETVITERNLFNYNLEPDPVFHVIPNAIIFAVQAADYADIDTGKPERPRVIFDSTESNEKLYILKQSISEGYKLFFIIDGYHRLLGFSEYSKRMNNAGFEFIASFLINRRREEEAEIFTTVNKTATKVDSSYYYHVVGEFEIGKKEHIYLHYLVRYYNEVLTDGVFHSRIKMLGKRDACSEKKQVLSQSFFIEQIFDFLLKDKGYIDKRRFLSQRFPKKIPILRYYLVNENEQENQIARHLVCNYFEAVRSKIDHVDDGNIEPFYLKTLLFGALIAVLPYVYFEILRQHASDNISYENVRKLLSNESLFSRQSFEDVISALFELVESKCWLEYIYESEYKGASSQGLVKRLSDAICSKLNYPLSDDIQGVYVEIYNSNVSAMDIAVKI